MNFLVHLLVVAASLGVATYMLPGVTLTSLPAVIVAAIVLGLVNATVRPVIAILTLPLTILTLGLFYLVVNGIAFSLASWITPGFYVAGFGSAILGALIVSVVSWLIGSFARSGA